MSFPFNHQNSVSYVSVRNDPLTYPDSRSSSRLSSSSLSTLSVPLLTSDTNESKEKNDDSLIFERNVEKIPLFSNQSSFSFDNNNNKINNNNIKISSNNSLYRISNYSHSNILSIPNPNSHQYSNSTALSNNNYIYECNNNNTNSTITPVINNINNSSILPSPSIENRHTFENYIPPNLDEIGDLVTDTDKNLEDINIKYGSNRPSSTIGLNIALGDKIYNNNTTNSVNDSYKFTKRSLSSPYIHSVPSNESIKDDTEPLYNFEGDPNDQGLIKLYSYADIIYNEANQSNLKNYPSFPIKTDTVTTNASYINPHYDGKNNNNNNNNNNEKNIKSKQFHIESSEEEEDEGDI